jgi:sugar/nucleoside kinase (ribokinase family)
VVGTAGSGDATIAGFLAAFLRDMTPEEAVTMAVAVGACNVEAADTLSGIRPWDETLRRVAAGWPRRIE